MGHKGMQAFCLVFAILVILYLVGVASLYSLRSHKRRYLIELLRQVVVTFDEHGIPYVIYWGTLLGSVREQQIIPNDDDVDFVVFGEANQARALQALADKYGAKRIHGTKFHYTGMFRALHADIQYASQDSDGQWIRRDIMAHLGKMRADTLTARDRVPMHGVQVSIPPNAHGILQELYGPDYMTPQAYRKTDGDPRHDPLQLKVRALFKDIGLFI